MDALPTLVNHIYTTMLRYEKGLKAKSIIRAICAYEFVFKMMSPSSRNKKNKKIKMGG